jgi:hypothetical protein
VPRGGQQEPRAERFVKPATRFMCRSLRRMSVDHWCMVGGSGIEIYEQLCLVEDKSGFLSAFAASNSLAFSFGVSTPRLRAVRLRCYFGLSHARRPSFKRQALGNDPDADKLVARILSRVVSVKMRRGSAVRAYSTSIKARDGLTSCCFQTSSVAFVEILLAQTYRFAGARRDLGVGQCCGPSMLASLTHTYRLDLIKCEQMTRVIKIVPSQLLG